MSTNIGTKRVLTALAETVSGFSETLAQPPEGHQDVALGATLPTANDGAEAGAGSDSVARYVEHDLLGQGGLGEVLEVYDRDLRREVALKRPRPERQGAGHVAALVEEAQIQAQLEHPNIPAVHALGIDAQGRAFFTMTRLRGQTLSALLRERQQDPEIRAQVSTGRLLRIFLQIGSAVAFAHERGVVHRDLKPENVIIGAFGEVRVMDWWIAKLVPRPASGDTALRPSSVSTSVQRPGRASGAIVGTPGYAAPEQMRGDPDTGPRADIYGLGALLFDMLAGRPPIVGETAPEIIEATLAGRVTPLLKLVPVSKRLAAVVHRALATDPADRYDDVPALLRDVEAVLEGRPVTALQEGSMKRLGRFYLSQSHRYARFRTLDVDLLCWACYALGVASGAFLIYWKTPHLGLIALVAMLLGLAALIVPAYTLLRKPRPDDPGTVIPYSEGLTTSYVSRSSSPSANANADTVSAAGSEGREDM